MAQHNLGTVISFEFIRTITKRRFWIGTLAVPVIMAVVFLLIFVSNSTTSSSADAQKNAHFSIAYTDQSGLITPQTVKAFDAARAPSPEDGLQDVQAGRVDAYFAFPADPSRDSVKVYAADKGVFENGKYPAVAQAMLNASVQQKIGSPELAALAQGKANIDVTTYQGANEAGGVNAVIPPMVYLVVFYGLVILLASQMLNSTLEEKENRVTEMILTTLKPTTLITGKVVALFMVGLVQTLVFLLPVEIGYLFFRGALNIPTFDLSHLVFEPGRMTVGFLILLGGFSLFTTTLVAIGAVMPTAKEAGSFMGVMMALIFVPFYSISLVISDPHAPIVQIFTYFPFSAPVTGLLRNGFGSLNPVESITVIAILFICAAVMLRLAVRLFQYGSIEYTRKVSLRTALGSSTRAEARAAREPEYAPRA